MLLAVTEADSSVGVLVVHVRAVRLCQRAGLRECER